jgi:hypothetical protein
MRIKWYGLFAGAALVAIVEILFCPCSVSEEVYKSAPWPITTQNGDIVYGSRGSLVSRRTTPTRGVWNIRGPDNPFATAFGGRVQSGAIDWHRLWWEAAILAGALLPLGWLLGPLVAGRLAAS